MKVLVFMCGEGLGHTTRCLAFASRLVSAGYEVVFCGYGYSKTHIEGAGYRVLEVPSELKLVGSGGSLNIRGSIKNTLRGVEPLGYKNILSILQREKPDVVVSDSYLSIVLVCKVLKIPVILIVNQTNVYNFFKNRGTNVELVGKLVKSYAETVFKQADRIVVPDFPPPYTICEGSVGLTDDLINKIEYVGPLVRKKPSEVKALDLPDNSVFSMVGGFGYREKLFHNIISSARSIRDHHFILVAGPNINSADLEKKLPGNVEVIKYLHDVFPHINSSDLIIAPGGHSTIMECLSFGKPILSFPDLLHSEQQNNARRVHELRVGMHLSYFTPSFMVEDAIKESMKYKKNCAKMREFSERLDGPHKMVSLIEEMA